MQREPVSSSNLTSVGYDEDSQTLEIEFRSGGIYQYFGVPKGTYEELMSAGSKGTYFARNIRNSFPTSRVG